jgi:hypothetical protein
MATYIDEALIKHALKQSTITSIIQKKLYHIQAPQDAQPPYVVLNLVVPSDESEQLSVRDFGQPLFQWTCVSRGPTAKTPADAFLVAHAIKAAFRDLSGTVEGILIKYSWSWGPRELSGVGKDDDITCIVETEVHYEGI